MIGVEDTVDDTISSEVGSTESTFASKCGIFTYCDTRAVTGGAITVGVIGTINPTTTDWKNVHAKIAIEHVGNHMIVMKTQY
jgi:hypothetical protein